MFTIYDYMTPDTLAGIVAAARKAMDDGIYDEAQLMVAVNAGKALTANCDHDAAQELIDALMNKE